MTPSAHRGAFQSAAAVGFRNLIFQAEIVEQRFRAACCPIMISRPPAMRSKQSMGLLPSNLLLLNLILPIAVIFSTPTGHYTQNPNCECDGDVAPTTEHAPVG